jgi:hypothetical protein
MASTQRKGSSPDDPIHALALERVNTHLQLIDAETRIRRQQAEIENYENAPPISDSSNASGSLLNSGSPAYGLNFDRENQAQDVYKDLQTNSPVNWPHLPDQRLNALLEQRQFLNDLEAKQRRAIIRELTMQAEAAGYDLVVGEDNVAHVRRKRVQTFDPFRASPSSK